MTTTGSTDKADIARAMAMAVAELRRYGGTEAEVKAVTFPANMCNGDSDSKAVPYFAQKYWGEFDYKPIEVTTKHTNPEW